MHFLQLLQLPLSAQLCKITSYSVTPTARKKETDCLKVKSNKRVNNNNNNNNNNNKHFFYYMVWIKIAFSTTSTTSFETFNICFASGSTSSLPRTQARSSGLESNWIMVSRERRSPFPTSFPSTLNVPMVHCAILSLESACSFFQTHLRRLGTRQTSSHVQRKHRHRDTKVHLVIL